MIQIKISAMIIRIIFFSTWVTSHMLVTHLMLLQMTNTAKNINLMLLLQLSLLAQTVRFSCPRWQNGQLSSNGEPKWNRGGVEVDREQWRGWQRQVPLLVVASSLATLPGLVPAHQHDDDGDDGDTDDADHLPHCTMCCLYSIFSLQPNEVGHDLTPHNHSTYFFHNSFDCEENYFMNVFVSFKLEICDFPWIIPLQQLLDFGVLCPNLCLNTWEFYYPPLYHTQGNIGQDPTATVQTAHCALASLSW